MKKILIINGHPNSNSYNLGLFEAYKKGAITSGADIKEIVIKDLVFNPNLQFGYQKRTELEPDLLDAWEKIKWADHLVWVHPVWWGGLPAVTKGFIDRLFLPGFFFLLLRGYIKREEEWGLEYQSSRCRNGTVSGDSSTASEGLSRHPKL